MMHKWTYYLPERHAALADPLVQQCRTCGLRRWYTPAGGPKGGARTYYEIDGKLIDTKNDRAPECKPWPR